MSIASTLGFYYLIFQQYSEKFVTCWFDGSENSELVPIGTFLKYAEAFSNVLDIRWQLEDALHTTSIYLLDVESEIIARLKPGVTMEDSSDLLPVLERNRTAQIKAPFSTNISSVYSNGLQTLKNLF